MNRKQNKTRKIIEAKFDSRLEELYRSSTLENVLLRIRSPGTRTEAGFRTQIEIYEVLDGPVKEKFREVNHVRYLGYLKVNYNPTTTELPEFFVKLGEQLLNYIKK